MQLLVLELTISLCFTHAVSYCMLTTPILHLVKYSQWMVKKKKTCIYTSLFLLENIHVFVHLAWHFVTSTRILTQCDHCIALIIIIFRQDWPLCAVALQRCYFLLSFNCLVISVIQYTNNFPFWMIGGSCIWPVWSFYFFSHLKKMKWRILSLRLEK